jgi:hypothetical protein
VLHARKATFHLNKKKPIGINTFVSVWQFWVSKKREIFIFYWPPRPISRKTSKFLDSTPCLISNFGKMWMTTFNSSPIIILWWILVLRPWSQGMWVSALSSQNTLSFSSLYYFCIRKGWNIYWLNTFSSPLNIFTRHSIGKLGIGISIYNTSWRRKNWNLQCSALKGLGHEIEVEYFDKNGYF